MVSDPAGQHMIGLEFRSFHLVGGGDFEDAPCPLGCPLASCQQSVPLKIQTWLRVCGNAMLVLSEGSIFL